MNNEALISVFALNVHGMPSHAIESSRRPYYAASTTWNSVTVHFVPGASLEWSE